MNETSRAMPPVRYDDARRLLWITPLALLLWTSMLTVFGVLLWRTAAPPPEASPLEARIVELPPEPAAEGPAAPAGAKPLAHAQPRRAAAPLHVPPQPHPRMRAVHHERAFTPPSEEGTAKTPPQASATPAPSSAPATNAAAGNRAGAAGSAAGAATGGGLGSDQSGARALYAPTPEIPDDLRDQPLQAVAVAHFVVASDGAVTVTLVQPTDNPRLNQVLLDTLKQWRFAPAIRHGVAIDSQFDVRIPVDIE
ncbi:MAG TPA: TonB family protein [Candidatus Binataceae bacterium]|nr:TonB family protein [Candidatus Binataceae bacterium]